MIISAFVLIAYLRWACKQDVGFYRDKEIDFKLSRKRDCYYKEEKKKNKIFFEINADK
jgi:hypothetical protein